MKGIILADGITQALGLVEDFAGNESVVVILSDNIFEASLKKTVKNFDGEGSHILIQELHDPHRYGVAELNDVNNFYIEKGLMKSSVLDSWWTDAGTLESYKHANKLVQNNS